MKYDIWYMSLLQIRLEKVQKIKKLIKLWM